MEMCFLKLMGLLGTEGYYARTQTEKAYIHRLVTKGFVTLKKNSKSVYTITQKGREYLFSFQIDRIKQMANYIKDQHHGTSLGVFASSKNCYILLRKEKKRILLAIQNPFLNLDEFLENLDIELNHNFYDRVLAFVNHGDPEQYNPSSSISWVPLEDPWPASTAISTVLSSL